MIQILFTVAVFGFCACACLENIKYLPPATTFGSGAGGAPGFVAGTGRTPGKGYVGAGGVGGGYASGSPGAGFEIPIIRYENVNNGDGTYQYLYETGNGIKAQEQGDARGDGTQAQGSFSYTAPDGQQIQIQYTADENGFIPQGAHLPTSPPIPPEILKSIEQNLADEARGIIDEGAYRPGLDEGGAGGYSGGADRSVAQGSYSYTAPEGKRIEVQYTPDEIPPESIEHKMADEDGGGYAPSGGGGAPAQPFRPPPEVGGVGLGEATGKEKNKYKLSIFGLFKKKKKF